MSPENIQMCYKKNLIGKSRCSLRLYLHNFIVQFSSEEFIFIPHVKSWYTLTPLVLLVNLCPLFLVCTQTHTHTHTNVYHSHQRMKKETE
jgi:hypothetical protein